MPPTAKEQANVQRLRMLYGDAALQRTNGFRPPSERTEGLGAQFRRAIGVDTLREYKEIFEP